ncbi:MAG: hypothetical protein EOO54_28480 [Haliea sp.]|nr:MAG: hypothetical protein EOO54_28480 [Haliea sp.]
MVSPLTRPGRVIGGVGAGTAAAAAGAANGVGAGAAAPGTARGAAGALAPGTATAVASGVCAIPCCKAKAIHKPTHNAPNLLHCIATTCLSCSSAGDPTIGNNRHKSCQDLP